MADSMTGDSVISSVPLPISEAGLEEDSGWALWAALGLIWGAADWPPQSLAVSEVQFCLPLSRLRDPYMHGAVERPKRNQRPKSDSSLYLIMY